ncbi:MAG: peptidoglycan-binding protein [Clostridia bacterium]|nr:peptidoglycan-binding protein [Clostridia bacterium]
MKRYVAALLLFMILPLTAAATQSPDVVTRGATGTDIYSIQVRLIDLGYLNYRATGKYSDMTTSAVRSFQQRNGLPADGQIGAETMRVLFSDSAVRQGANPRFSSAVGRAYTGAVSSKGTVSSWDAIDARFPVGSEARITDYNTGESFTVVRTGGINNAEVTAASPQDNETFSYVFGGYSWEHRPVLVEIGGTQYAGSLFGMPTSLEIGGSSGMSGSTFLYFNNARSDVYELADEEHVIAITAVAETA